MIKVLYESKRYNDEAESLSGKSVQDVYDAVKTLFDLPSEDSVEPRVNGDNSEYSDDISSGDEVEFVAKTSGKKG